jgi:iron complex transport system ATP-binding protein
MSKSMLGFKKVEFSYPGSKNLVLKDFSIGIQPGSVTAILGPNGTGKTTMLMLSLGWLIPDKGEICLLESSIATMNRQELGQKIGLVPQFEHLSFDFTLLEYVVLGRAPYLRPLQSPSPEDFEIAQSALKRVGMEKYSHKQVQELSGGEKQLVLLARALAQDTNILLLDEPTSHLDIKNKSRLLKILKELIAEGKTIILTTHEPDVASMIATDLILVKEGQVLKHGKIDQVMTTENLSEVYSLEVVVKEIGGHKVFLWE